MSKSKEVVIYAEKIKYVNYTWDDAGGVPFIKEAFIVMKTQGGRHKLKVVVENN